MAERCGLCHNIATNEFSGAADWSSEAADWFLGDADSFSGSRIRIWLRIPSACFVNGSLTGGSDLFLTGWCILAWPTMPAASH
jgi:hypothetical protein